MVGARYRVHRLQWHWPIEAGVCRTDYHPVSASHWTHPPPSVLFLGGYMRTDSNFRYRDTSRKIIGMRFRSIAF